MPETSSHSGDTGVTTTLPRTATGEADTLVMRRGSRDNGRRSRPLTRFGALGNTSSGIWLGIALTAIGFGTIFYAWVQVARLLNVAQQVPYVVSGGLLGLALIIIGVVVIDIALRQQDAHDRRQQLAQMNRVLTQLQNRLSDNRDTSYR